ncbi:hypothetical protein [Arthrobacter sp. H14]|uniref:hypothetical protein n=1 Tax=Arthrobacter sp. H14 TaxID=1312959 RepID=UPI00047CF2CC|nr:hypothetical protein [Arthrobacter sp. H14]
MQRPNSHATHSGEGHLVSNVIIFTVLMVLFLGALYAFSFWSLDNVFVPGIIGMVLFALSFWIPKQIMGSMEKRTREK